MQYGKLITDARCEKPSNEKRVLGCC